MAPFTLVIGNKNYSSWSLRPWLLLKHLGVAFTEILVPLDQPSTRDDLEKYSPSARVPVLRHGELTVWDSLAICEYLAELTGRGWPAAPAARAVARAVSAEMHSGFTTLRSLWPMNARARNRRTAMTPGLEADIERIDQIWNDCRARFGGSGPWLFGDYSIADAMFAPVVLRFNTYGAGAVSHRALVHGERAGDCRAAGVAAGRQSRVLELRGERGRPVTQGPEILPLTSLRKYHPICVQ